MRSSREVRWYVVSIEMEAQQPRKIPRKDMKHTRRALNITSEMKIPQIAHYHFAVHKNHQGCAMHKKRAAIDTFEK